MNPFARLLRTNNDTVEVVGALIDRASLLTMPVPQALERMAVTVLSLEEVLEQAVKTGGNSQAPAHIWAVREGLLRLETCPYILRRAFAERTCRECGLTPLRLEYMVSVETEPGSPSWYEQHLCISCMAEILLSETSLWGFVLNRVGATHWDTQLGLEVDFRDVYVGDESAQSIIAGHQETARRDRDMAREGLTLLTWTLPLADVARVAEMSEIGVAKLCRQNGVSVPGDEIWGDLHQEYAVEAWLDDDTGRILHKYGYDPDEFPCYQDWLDNLPWDDQTGSQETLAALRKLMDKRRFY